VTTALSIYGLALRAALAGNHAPVRLVDVTGQHLRSAQVEAWCATSRVGDAGLIDRCVGPTLDVGCGPGRLAAALKPARPSQSAAPGSHTGSEGGAA